MISANELRIGNWVYDFGQNPVQVIRLTKGKQPLERPIPLTPEILESCGFNKNLDFPNNSFYSLSMNNSKSYFLNVVLDEYSTDTIIEYLHQLQNLYFALTGEELNINLNVETLKGR